MAKYGRGLNIEFVEAVKKGEVSEPFATEDVRIFIKSKGWNPPESYIVVMLPNGSSQTHSNNYKKLFNAIGGGQYILSDKAKLGTI